MKGFLVKLERIWRLWRRIMKVGKISILIGLKMMQRLMGVKGMWSE